MSDGVSARDTAYSVAYTLCLWLPIIMAATNTLTPALDALSHTTTMVAEQVFITPLNETTGRVTIDSPIVAVLVAIPVLVLLGAALFLTGVLALVGGIVYVVVLVWSTLQTVESGATLYYQWRHH